MTPGTPGTPDGNPGPDAPPARDGSVVLAFPPLVESSFGRYFPSTAVLAGFLQSRKVRTHQWDLNEEFALHLLDPGHLAEAGAGRLVGLEGRHPEEMSAVAGRWLARHRDALFDERGRHTFAAASGPEFLLSALARPYLIDPEAEWLTDPALLRSDRTLVYRAYYASLGLADRLPGDTRLLGVSVPMGPQLVPALLLAEAVKQVRPDVRIVLGGPTLSLMNEHDLARLLDVHRQVDAVVRFDGEAPLLALWRQADGGAWRPGEVAGVSALVDGTPVHTPPTAGLHPNALPPAAYDPVLMARLVGPEMGIVQARGCYWGKCDYCDFVELYDGSPPYRGRSVQSFMAELEHQVSTHGVRRFELITESIPPAFARRFAQAVLDRGLDITWNSFAMVDRRFDAELLQLMVRAGCEYLVIGMETTNTRVLKLVHKSADREENLRFIREAHQAGMKLRINLIPDLPSTTVEEAMESLRDVAELADCIESFTVFPFEATRSSEVGRHPERFGLVVGGDGTGLANQAQYALNHLGNIDPAMTREERTGVHRAYQDFAIGHGSAHMRRTGDEFLDRLPGEGEAFRLGVASLDVLPRGDELVVTHVLRRERTVLPAAVARGLTPWLDGTPLTRRDLTQAYGAAGGAAVLRQLVEARLLTAVAATGRPEPALT
ncbi:B12-binding domain-containing radical SAM protein [Streptomyces sp. NPDC096319]|uniref:B12-binding domain-containing radical SAM protein n=1 Tax=Streptomyces sp. NPDC096319 TaxID=3366084 RepID=UPI00382ECF3A